eukprot:Rhum_TRINITY_DN14239_c10_g1::Rhum_TRINITY_DN14239_c10_g1_i1::g.75563::m.75563
MARGSIKHDHSRKGIIPGQAKLQKNRRSIRKRAEKEKLAILAVNVEESVKKIEQEQEGQLVPIKPGKLIKPAYRISSTPPPHQNFTRRSVPKKLNQGKMSAVVRKMVKARKTAATKK